MDNSGRRLLIGLMAVILAVAIGSAGFMLGYAASGGAAVSAKPIDVPTTARPVSPEAPAAEAPAASTSSPADEEAEFKIFWEAWQTLKAEYYGDDLPDAQNLAYNAIRGVIFGLEDQFTSFVTPSSAKLIEEDSTGSFSGIGAVVQLNKQRVLQISRVYADSPAEQSGLKAGDLITEVDGESMIGDDLSEQVAKVRGPAGTVVKLTIIRGEDKPFTVDVTRATIEIKLVESRLIDDIAYVALSKFDSSTTAQQLDDTIRQLLANNPRGLILDLRGNPGGFLDQSIAVADLFLNEGVVLYERTKDGEQRVFRSDDDGAAQDVPLVVLINGGSASASEIVAGAIQDRGRGKLIGETSFGKGSVQQINRLSDGSQLRVTIARWFTPNDRAIHGEGLEPDITVEAGDDPKIDTQLDRAVEYLTTGK
ncbi:MAG: S41 family peptidase [Chloroflexi bacterium]|nr:S41 family peptidase [Chloroflexota bacterium]